MSLFAKAERIAQGRPRRFLDWEGFWRGDDALDPNDHKLYLGALRSCFDDCCHRQLADRSQAPYPRLSVITPYLKLIAEGIEEAPRVPHEWLCARRPPVYFDSPWSGHLVYVDLWRAYWSIYTRATLDVFYDGEHAPRAGVIRFLDAEALGADRLVRNATLGTLRRQWRRGLDHGTHFREPVPPGKRRPDLWALVMDCLEVVAWAMRDLGALYIHTDGYVFGHRDLADDAIALLWEKFALRASIRAEGDGEILALGRWRIGDATAGTEVAASKRIDSMLQAPRPLGDALTAWMHGASLLAV